MANETLNLDHDECRALHRIVRAMHDGECPKCHAVSPSDKMRRITHVPFVGGKWDGWICPECGFSITEDEAAEVFAIFAPFMERNLAVFEKWRASRQPAHLNAAGRGE